MRLVTYRSTVEAAARLGAVVDDLVVDVEEAGQHAGISLPSSMLDFIDLGPPALAALFESLSISDCYGPILPLPMSWIVVRYSLFVSGHSRNP